MKAGNAVAALALAFAAGCPAWGRSFAIDLCGQRRADRSAKSPKAAASAADGAVRSFKLGAGSADVGEVAIGDELEFRLFDDVTLSLSLREKTPTSPGADAFLADVSGLGGASSAVVLRTADGLTLDVQDVGGERVYKVLSTPGGVTVREVARSRGGSCGCCAELERGCASSESSGEASPDAVSRDRAAAEQGDTTVDILVAYDLNAAAWAEANGGGLTNFALVAVQKMNLALANTGLDESFRFRLVGICRIGVSSSDPIDALWALDRGDEGWRDVKTAREAVGADMFTVLIDTGVASGTTGVAWYLRTKSAIASFGADAYNVCAIRSVAQSHTMTHECGHCLGAGHARNQETEPGPQFYDYSSAWYFRAGDRTYSTIMAYSDENPDGVPAVEVPYFSSPCHFYEGVAVGDEMNDNTRTIAENFRYAVNWRAQKVPMSYDITFEPASGTVFDGSLQVTIKPGKTGAEVRYTLDGSDPAPSSPLYTGPVEIDRTATFRAATSAGGVCSFPYEATYCARADYDFAFGPSASPWRAASGDGSACEVQTTNSTDGAAVCATVAQGESCSLSTVVSGPATVAWKRMASGSPVFELLCDAEALVVEEGAADGWTGQYAEVPEGEHEVEFRLAAGDGGASHWLDDFRVYKARRPVFLPAGDDSGEVDFSGEITVAMAAEDEGAAIYFTLDGSDPCGDGATLYTGPFALVESTVVKAVAVHPEKGASPVAEMLYAERHVPSAGEWTLWGEGAWAAVAKSGRMIAELRWTCPDGEWSSELEKVVTNEQFTTWAAANGVYLLADSWGDRVGASGSRFHDLYWQTELYEEMKHYVHYPTFVFVSASDPAACLGAMLARDDRRHTVNGLYYRDTPESLIECFSSFLCEARPLGAPLMETAGSSSVALSNTNATGTIYYTLDGSVPTRENGIPYAGAFKVPKSGVLIKAVVWPDGDDAVSGVPLVTEWKSSTIDVAVSSSNPALGVATGAKSAVKIGAKVALKATANKGAVFVGWFTNGVFVASSASYTYVASGVDDVAFEARFVTAAEDKASLELAVADVQAEVDGTIALDLARSVKSLSAPKLAVSGLPSGVKFDAKTMKVSGKAAKPGVYDVKVSATNASATGKDAVVSTFKLTVPNFRWNESAVGAALEDRYLLVAGVAPALSNEVAAVTAKGWKLAVSGLPSGVKFDAKKGQVTGIASKEGFFTVFFTATKGKEKEVATATFAVSFPTLALDVAAWNDASATNKATVAGGGRYPAGKKVTLKASPAKGSVFVGWREGDGTEFLSQSASYSHVTTTDDMTFVAVFAKEAEDAASLTLDLADAQAEADGSISLDLGACVESLSLPKLAVSGLPSGVKYDAKTMKASGKATKPGVYKVKVSTTNTSVKKATDKTTALFNLTVPNFKCAALPKLRDGAYAYGTLLSGVALDPGLIDCRPENGWTVKASGLPSGLKYDAKTGLVSGVPTAKAGSYTVTFTATRKGAANQVATITLNVEALPAWAVGTFDGAAFCWGGQPCGLVSSFTVAANGKISGKLLEGGRTWALSAASFAAVANESERTSFIANVIGKSGNETTTNEVAVSADTSASFERGVAEGEGWKAWQNLWKATQWKEAAKPFASKKLTVAVDAVDGAFTSGTIELKFASSGAVTAAGKFVTDTVNGKDVVHSASCSSVLVPQGDGVYDAFIYFPRKADSRGNVAFEGYSGKITLRWSGTAFGLLEEGE